MLRHGVERDHGLVKAHAVSEMQWFRHFSALTFLHGLRAAGATATTLAIAKSQPWG